MAATDTASLRILSLRGSPNGFVTCGGEPMTGTAGARLLSSRVSPNDFKRLGVDNCRCAPPTGVAVTGTPSVQDVDAYRCTPPIVAGESPSPFSIASG